MALPPLDVLATPPGQGAGGVAASDGSQSLAIPLRGVRLIDFAETPRFRRLDRQESYFRKRQDERKLYDWDGRFMGYGDEAPIKPGFVVPYAQRRPASRYDIATVIVKRYTALLFGADRFPEITIPGDADAEDYAKALINESRLPLRMIEARNGGGSVGTGCLSFGFVEGRPRVEVHNAKHCTVLRWADESERRPAEVIKAYTYVRDVYDPDSKRIRPFRYLYARYWNEQIEVVWEPIPYKLGETFAWTNAPRAVAKHAFGFCPFYWIQNVSDSEDPDGEGDYEGLEPTMDEVNQILSAAAKGTKANVDPTLVIHMDPATANTGTVHKGSENAIFSAGGAEYLELKGQATAAAISMLDRLTLYVFDTAGVVKPDPEKLSGSAQSAQALRLLFAPMLAHADLLREQYGEFGIKPIVRDMLRAARMLIARGEAVVLPDRVEPAPPPEPEEPPEPREPGEPVEPPGPPKAPEPAALRTVARVPGKSENVVLNWNPYFPPTWEDITKAATAVQTANGKKPVLSQRSSIAAVQSLFGINDVDAEMAAIHEDGERALDQAVRAMGSTGPEPDLEGENEPGDAPEPGEE